MDRFSYSSAPIRRVKAIQFGVLDPDFLVRSRSSAPHWIAVLPAVVRSGVRIERAAVATCRCEVQRSAAQEGAV